jgi:hypothetical protein
VARLVVERQSLRSRSTSGRVLFSDSSGGSRPARVRVAGPCGPAQNTPENRPAGWKEQGNRWDRYHYVRVAVIVAAFALLAAAQA